MDNTSTELKDDQVAEARQTLAHRLSALERRVECAVDETTDTVKQTATAVRSSVTGAVDEARNLYQSATDAVKSAFDVPAHIREHPWPGVGIAAALGIVAAIVAKRATRHRESEPEPMRVSGQREPAWTEPRQSLSRRLNLEWLFGDSLDHLADVARKELVGLGETAIRAASGALRDNIETFADSAMGRQTEYDRRTGYTHAGSVG